MNYTILDHIELIHGIFDFDSITTKKTRLNENPLNTKNKLIKQRIILYGESRLGFSEDQIFGKCNRHDVCFFRFQFYRFFYKEFRVPKCKIADFFNKNNATILNAFKKYPFPKDELYMMIENDFEEYKEIIFDGII